MSKRGQGLSMNVIIIAAIALLVLVVLAVIFTSKSGTFVKGIDACTNKGGECVSLGVDETCADQGYLGEDAFGTKGCVDEQEGTACCIKS